ncbi:polysaccharide deacetylase family protein [Pseudomonas parakoreensis]
MAAALLLPALAFAQERPWPDGSQLVISVSMQFETGGQPEGAESPFSGTPLPKGYPDLPAQTWFDYGYKEGLWRMLDLWDRTGIKVTSHVVGEAALKHPELAKAIAARGHELAAHGMRWADSYNMSYDAGKTVHRRRCQRGGKTYRPALSGLQRQLAAAQPQYAEGSARPEFHLSHR